ncbi:MAG: hypothetical protein S4CHLAM81_13990 [Chlamydiales bacterium]|nr:hypothetical protein [Chlamydiales bacterium]MCH9636171.1 hypothetical protein [Chlamydiales bacterium]
MIVRPTFTSPEVRDAAAQTLGFGATIATISAVAIGVIGYCYGIHLLKTDCAVGLLKGFAIALATGATLSIIAAKVLRSTTKVKEGRGKSVSIKTTLTLMAAKVRIATTKIKGGSIND